MKHQINQTIERVLHVERCNLGYWQCPQNPEHLFDLDDWRVLPADVDELNATKWFKAWCAYDGRELEKHYAEVK